MFPYRILAVEREDSLSLADVVVDDVSSRGLEILSAFAYTMICPLEVHPVLGLLLGAFAFLAGKYCLF